MISVAAGFAALLIAAPVASAVESARDEYTLDLPGEIQVGGGYQGSPARDAAEITATPQGVAGENETTSSPLDSTLSTLLDAPLAIALGLAVGLAGAALAAMRLRPIRLR